MNVQDVMAQVTFGESHHQIQSKSTHPIAAATDSMLFVSHVLLRLPFSSTASILYLRTLTARLLFVCSQSLILAAQSASLHWLYQQLPMYKSKYRMIKRYIDSNIARAKESIRDGGEVAEIKSLVSPLALDSAFEQELDEKSTDSECFLPLQVDIAMRKEERDGKEEGMSDDELRDEMLLGESLPPPDPHEATSWRILIITSFVYFFDDAAMLAGNDSTA